MPQTQHKALWLSVLLIFCGGLSACGASLKPHMVDSSAHPVYGKKAGGAFMHAVGRGTSRANALKDAKRKIAEQLQSNVRSRTEIQTSYADKNGKTTTSGKGDDTVIIDSSFKFAELIHEDPKEHTIIEEEDVRVHYVYVYMLKNECIKHLKTSMSEKLQIITALKGEVDKAKSQRRLNVLKNLMVQASEVSKELEKINRQAFAVSKRDLTSDHRKLTKRLYKAYTALKGQIKIGVRVDVDDSQLRPADAKKIAPIVKKLQGQALKAVSEVGLEAKLGDCNGDIDYQVHLVMKSSCRLASFGQRCVASSSGELMDCSNSGVIRSLDFTSGKSSASDAKRKTALKRLASSYTGARDKDGLKEIVKDVFHYEVGDDKKKSSR